MHGRALAPALARTQHLGGAAAAAAAANQETTQIPQPQKLLLMSVAATFWGAGRELVVGGGKCQLSRSTETRVGLQRFTPSKMAGVQSLG